MKVGKNVLFWSLGVMWMAGGYLLLTCSRGEAIEVSDVVTAVVIVVAVGLSAAWSGRRARARRGKPSVAEAKPFAVRARYLVKLFAVAIVLYGALMWLIDGVLRPLPLIVLAVWALPGIGLIWWHDRLLKASDAGCVE